MASLERRKDPGEAWETVPVSDSGSSTLYYQPGDPGAVGKGKLWLDTSEPQPELKQRNGDNDAWGQIYCDGIVADGPILGDSLGATTPDASGDASLTLNGGAIRDFIATVNAPPAGFVGMMAFDNTPISGGLYVWAISGGSGAYVKVAGAMP